MPRKIDFITELHNRTLGDVAKDGNRWRGFLRTAAYQYKYPFDDQLLIYAQKPGATACAELEVWNGRFNRWVNRGAHGIALIRETNGHLQLDHVFDVSDTHSRDNSELKLWNIPPEYEQEVVTALENRYGDTVSHNSLIDAVCSASLIAVEDNLQDYKDELLHSVENSFLDGYDDDNLRFRLMEMLQASVSYTILTRLGIDADIYIDEDAFRNIYEFSTPATVSVLGTANGDISEIILRDIERTVKSCEKENRSFDRSEGNKYNGGESQKLENGGKSHDEHSQLHTEERDKLPGADSAGTAGTDARQVRDAASGLSESAPEGDLLADDGERNADRASLGDRADSEGTDFGEYIPDGTEPWGNGEAESGEPDEVGADDEQSQSVSGGGSAEQTAFHINDKDLSVSNQPPRLMPDDLMQILRHGDYLKHSKAEIVSFLSRETDEVMKTAYIRQSYNKLTASMFRAGTSEYLGYSALFDDGLHVFAGTFMNPSAAEVLDWDFTRKLIEALIHDNNYLDEPKTGEQIVLSDIEPAEQTTASINTEPVQFRISQEIIDAFLRLGSCTKDSTYRIYGFYRRANNVEENIAFLKAEYESDAIGLIVNGQKAAAVWDESGVTLAQGESAYNAWNTHKLSWNDVDNRIRQLIEMGQYISQPETEQAIEEYDREVGKRTVLVVRDFLSGSELSFKPDKYMSWDDEGEYYRSIITSYEKIRQFSDEFSKAVDALTSAARRRSAYTPQFVKLLVGCYTREPVDYPASDYVLPPEHYLSQDQIDRELIGNGSGISRGKYRIYSFFLRNKNTQERAKFLNSEYGIGGLYSDRGGNNHDSKGLAIMGGLDKFNEMKILFNWTQVAKRIDELIRKDRYMTDKELDGLDNFEKENASISIANFYEGTADSVVKPFPSDLSFAYRDKIIDAIIPQLESSERVNEILGMMQSAFDNMIPDNRYYNVRKKALEVVSLYANGAFNLFPGAKSRRKTLSLPTQTDEKEPEQNISDVDLSVTGYSLSLGTFVYIGKEEYSILSASKDTVELFDGTLFPLEMSTDEFLRRIGENPLNDHLKITKEHSEAGTEIRPQQAVQRFVVVEAESDIDDPYEILDNETGKVFIDENGDRATFLTRWQAEDFASEQNRWLTEKDKDRTGELFYEDKKPDEDKYDIWQLYQNAKRISPNAIVLVPVGDFYEFLDGDAQVAANELGLTLTTREVFVGGRKPMCGIPAGKLDETIHVLTDKNYTVSVCDKSTDRTYDFNSPDVLDKEAAERENREIEAVEKLQLTDEETEKAEESDVLTVPTMKEEQTARKPVSFGFHPELPLSEKLNFHISDYELGVGGAKEKFKRNMEAILTLKQTDNEDRLATPEEQRIMSEYTGWGGLADVFDESNDNWANERAILKGALTEEEYTAAKESTLTAFYTPPTVIDAVYKALGNMGFVRGNILEPSCGIGNFIGMLPESMSESCIYGVELDSISGRIAQQLYQRESITVDGFENTSYPDSFFDIAIGNVPFGQFKVVDKKYDKHNFLIHDFFFAKAIDKVRPGGVIAFITAKGTMDKKNPAIRKYIARRADLIGAIRLPDTTFKASAGTEAVADIIFLQKRDRIIDTEPDWVHLGTDENGITMNSYFVEHPDMIMGEMVMRSGPFGPEPTCRAYDGQDLGEALNDAVANIHAEIIEADSGELTDEVADGTIPADPTVRNFSFTLVGGKVYYRENSVMKPVASSVTGENRIKGMIAIRDTVRLLIDAQMENAPDSQIASLQVRLNNQYDAFTVKYGLLNSRANATVFGDDSAYFLLCSLEILDDNNQELKAKADMFTKRTIKAREVIKSVDTASEALAVSLSERALVDMEYMSELTGKSEQELFADLKGVIFLNTEQHHPNEKKYLTADDYLSGNVRRKLALAKMAMEVSPDEYRANVEALEAVQPQDLTAAEIGVKLGSTWVPQEDIQDFMFELLGTPRWYSYRIQVKYVAATAQWLISGKSHDSGNIKAISVYGTSRINAYKIIEETLNLKDVRIIDYVEDSNGNKTPVLNKKETLIAQGKQEQIKRAFEEWIWKDPSRRERLCKLYNEKFNSTRPREFNGEHIKCIGMNPEITLREHQKNAMARIIYSGNSLLAHVVGSGKTFTMVASAQEMKRLGLCSKSMFVVPNHIIGQWASEYLQLYPSANILVATKKDFETKNRKKFCARIATGDYDAVIIGHSQFEKIPVSRVRQTETLQAEIDELTEGIAEIKAERGERMTVKQLMKMRKALQAKLDKLNDQSRKDDVVCFEELGVDRLFVDEAHGFKNLFVFSKMRNVAGIAQTEAQKSSDLYMKCRYLDDITDRKGVIFATGTPVSNSMVELYTMQRYLQYTELKNRGLSAFDSWASTFGETVTAIELAPDGSGYRTKTRFAKFFNIPELMAMYKQVADVQTADMLNLPVPEAHYHVVKCPPSDVQKAMVQSFAERAERIHNKMVRSDEDNMLLITNDGRKAALDQRIINSALPDFEDSKVNTCVNNVFGIWEETTEKRSAQMIFCDLSTPKGDGKFNVYDDIREKLIAKGIAPEEIAFIHTADTDVKKKELFSKVRAGQVRVLLGSTFKMGSGTNCQTRLVALHDLDVPWRPSDLEQRAGRIVRQGNENPEVDLYRYVTEGTFDAYSYQLLETKQKFISQIQTSKSPVRVAEDVDEMALSYAEIKALASGNPKIMEKMQLDNDVAKLKLQKASHLSQRYALEDKVIKTYPKEIAEVEARITGLKSDIQTVAENTYLNDKKFSPMVILGTTYTEKADAGKTILDICKRITNPDARPLGEYRGLKTEIGYDIFSKEFFICLKGKMFYKITLGQDANGIITRLDNGLEGLSLRLKNCEEQLVNLHEQVENAKAEIAAPFPDEDILQEKSKRLDELNSELNMDKKENELADDEAEQEDDEPDRDPRQDDNRDDR